MSEKFPPLEDETAANEATAGDETDFLKREADILGDEFKTEQDSELLKQDEDEDIKEFENQFPELDEAPAAAIQEQAAPENDEDDEFGEPQAATSTTTPSEAISHWKERRDLEISQRDQADEEAKEQLQEEAVKHIDNFYENYNKKKQQQLETTSKEAEQFLKERDEFFAQKNTTWDRALQLINIDDADVVGGRDRSKFKEILLRLKGNEKAPGASSY